MVISGHKTHITVCGFRENVVGLCPHFCFIPRLGRVDDLITYHNDVNSALGKGFGSEFHKKIIFSNIGQTSQY